MNPKTAANNLVNDISEYRKLSKRPGTDLDIEELVKVVSVWNKGPGYHQGNGHSYQKLDDKLINWGCQLQG
jgi:hypothetical protein